MKKEFIKRYGWTLLGIVAGMVGGYAEFNLQMQQNSD